MPLVMPIPFGYWYDNDIRWGDFSAETEFTTLFLPGLYTTTDEVYPPGTPRPWSPLQAAAIRHAADAGKNLLLNLYMGSTRRVPTPKTVAQSAPYWDKVVGLDLADEPAWSEQQVTDNLAGVRRTIAAWRPSPLQHVMRLWPWSSIPASLVPRPCGVTLSRDQVMGSTLKTWVNAGVDFINIEAYLDPPGPTNPTTAAQLLRAELDRQVARVPAHVKVGLILQSYTRNGAWDPEGIPALLEMQRETFRYAYDIRDRVIALTAFAYGRPSGVVTVPELRTVHKALVNQYKGVP